MSTGELLSPEGWGLREGLLPRLTPWSLRGLRTRLFVYYRREGLWGVHPVRLGTETSRENKGVK